MPITTQKKTEADKDLLIKKLQEENKSLKEKLRNYRTKNKDLKDRLKANAIYINR